jgi:glycine dehydrogenase subunit 2
VHHTHHDDLDDPERWAITWRAYQRKYFGAGARASSAEPAETAV